MKGEGGAGGWNNKGEEGRRASEAAIRVSVGGVDGREGVCVCGEKGAEGGVGTGGTRVGVGASVQINE